MSDQVVSQLRDDVQPVIREHVRPGLKAVVATFLVDEADAIAVREELFESYGRRLRGAAIAIRDAVDLDLPRNHFTDEELAQIDR